MNMEFVAEFVTIGGDGMQQAVGIFPEDVYFSDNKSYNLDLQFTALKEIGPGLSDAGVRAILGSSVAPAKGPISLPS